MADLCTICGANLDMVGRAHRCVPRSSGGIAEGRKAAPGLPVANEHRGTKVRSGALERSLDRGDGNPKGGDVAPDTRQPAVGIKAGPSEAKPKRGRPRIGEEREKPWEVCGMTERTYYRRRAEEREKSK